MTITFDWITCIILAALYTNYIVAPCLMNRLASIAVKHDSSLNFAYHYILGKQSKRIALFAACFLFGWLMQCVEALAFIKILVDRGTADREAVTKIFNSGKTGTTDDSN